MKKLIVGLVLLMISSSVIAEESICQQYPQDPICQSGGPIGGGGHGGSAGGGGSCGGGAGGGR